MKYEVSAEDIKRAKTPHEIFLINLVFNHVLLFVAFLTAQSLQFLLLIVPIFSVTVLTYTFYRARRSLKIDPWFVKCHWQICARRSLGFLTMLAIMLVVMVIVYLWSGGDLKPQHWALAGVGALPTMITVLVLIVMESDAMHQANQGMVSKTVAERYPEGALEPIEE
ncbi:hypothetical protein BOW53_05465 [Solemya pervernicosa gill symbiont]|uniref:Uncharacterized protein n=2 Tax=Gammaproteobacteria incertae sedis TaxID=118884 RepID=A0A1T2L7L5_9GAMM|nr:hypothetical protein [Candidatus Reidiella endopervernicosa]OOZ41042.1 hypothetical protein BOW53_05465 [Solemya pervernicosa gill symbiont]QKQ25026.1 hypothetical protein HUE57_01030 [Candidatus Reidiella endopervernicosa]